MINKNESDLEKGVEIPHSAALYPSFPQGGKGQTSPLPLGEGLGEGRRIPQSNALRILLLEDGPTDAELNEHVLRKAGIAFTSLRVENHAEFVAALDTFRPDIILADYKLPGFDGLQALDIVRERSPDLPYIFVTGTMGEEKAVEAVKRGANDYILKDRLARLPIAVQHALEERKTKQQHRESEEKFRKISESAQDAIIMMGADQRILFWNAAAVQIFGYTVAEAMGQELHALIAPAPARAGFTHAFPHFQKTGEGPIIGKMRELTALHKGGAEFQVELSVSATQFGGQWHAIGIVRDITERKQAEIQLNEQLDELRRWQEVMLGREMRTLEVMREVNELLAQAGQPPRYSSVEASAE